MKLTLKFLQNLIEATLSTDKFEAEDVLIPRIPMSSMTTSFHFNVVRRDNKKVLCTKWRSNRSYLRANLLSLC